MICCTFHDTGQAGCYRSWNNLLRSLKVIDNVTVQQIIYAYVTFYYHYTIRPYYSFPDIKNCDLTAQARMYLAFTEGDMFKIR